MGIMLHLTSFYTILSLDIYTYIHTNTFFSAAFRVVDDGDDGPCETETCHIVEGHEIEVAEPGTA